MKKRRTLLDSFGWEGKTSTQRGEKMDFSCENYILSYQTSTSEKRKNEIFATRKKGRLFFVVYPKKEKALRGRGRV